ncbi:Deleted in lung and esophageal cancer protein 1 [Taenia crassiceps]|uniref:Deleted in lung and esophageal cancer protein 1 n=1 Tax=Taenia crassiceps TaxID=6207 RepID=A0ABR4QQC2_9CEST
MPEISSGERHYPEKGSNLIAPGLSCSYLVKLISTDLQDNVCETLQIFHHPGEEPLRVRIFAKREEDRITFPQVVDMGLCLVNSTISKLLPFNFSSKKNTRISLRLDLNGVFDVLPRECKIVQGMTTEALIKFCPIASGEFRTTLQVESNNQRAGEIVCHGYGENLQVDMLEETNGDQLWLLRKEILNDGRITAYCQVPDVYPGFQLGRQFRLRNEGNVTICLYLDKEDSTSGGLPSGFNASLGELTLSPKSLIPLNVLFCSERLGKHITTLTVRAAQLHCKEIFEVLKLYASAAVVPPEITLSPNAIILADPIVLTETAKFQVKMSNPSANCPVSFCWTLPRTEAEDSDVSFCPKSGELLTLETRTVNISITPKGLGQWQYLLSCNLNESSETSVVLRISCEVVSPSVELETDLLNFGVVCPNQSLTKNTYLRNPSSTSLTWSANCSQESNSPFTIRPSGGTIKPKHEQTILVKFHPQDADCFQEEVEFKVEGAPPPPRTLSLIGEAQIADVTMEPREIQIKELYATVPQNFTIKLKNHSLVPTKFCWLPAEYAELRSVRVSLSLMQGHIRPYQCVDVVVTLTATTLGDVEDYTLLCAIDGIPDPLVFKISAAILGLSCRISVLPECLTMKDNEMFKDSSSVHLNHQIFEADGPAVTFTPMSLWMPREVYVTVENTSGIPAVFTLKLDHFQSQEQVPLDSTIFQHEDCQTQNAKVYGFCRQLLKSKRPFAISVDPNSSTINLLAHETVTVRLVGCADIFGEFHDTMTISVVPLKNYETEPRALVTRLPVIAWAYGSPVDFLTAKKSVNKEAFDEFLGSKVMDTKFSELLLSSASAQETTANLGVVSSITGAIKREVKLRNNSSFTVRIDWHLYCCGNGEGERLLDLCAIVNDQTHFNNGRIEPVDALETKPLISLLIRAHEGYAVSRSHATACRLVEPLGINKSGITISPLQTIIPPHREASTFRVGDHVRLPEPLLLPHLRLNLKATAIQPVVNLEYGDELDTPVKLLPFQPERPHKPFQITLRAEDFILSTSQFSSVQQKFSQRYADEDQLLIVEHSKSPRASRHLASQVWCFQRLIVRNLSPYPIAVQADVSEGEFCFKEDIQVKAKRCKHIIEILDAPQAKDPLHSKKWLKLAANEKKSILLGCPVTRTELSKASASRVHTWFGKLSCALCSPEQAETTLMAANIQIDLEGNLKLPELVLMSPMMMDFPDTAINQSSTLDVKIANLGVSGTMWVVKPANATKDKKLESKGLKVFSITPTSGFLASTADTFRQDHTRLSVKFTPRMARECTEELVILDALTNRSVSVHLRGRGYLQHLPNH